MVIDYFTSEYRAGRTPNPCVMCNEKLKFGNLLTKARALGATHIATGHYARIERGGRRPFHPAQGRRREEGPVLFLFSLRQEQLAAAILPLGGLTKPEARALAKKMGLKTYDKEDSQEICFVPGNDYTAFLESHLGEKDFSSRRHLFQGRHPDGRPRRASSTIRGRSARGSAADTGGPSTSSTSTPRRSGSLSAITTISCAGTVISRKPTGAWN